MFSNYAAYYIQANIICIAVMVILLLQVVQGLDTQEHRRYQAVAIFTQILYFAGDIIWTCVDAEIWPRTVFALNLTNVINYLLMCLIGTSLLFYSLCMQGSAKLHSSRRQLLFSLPAIINAALIATTPRTHLYFHAEERAGRAELVQGPLYYVMVVIALGYPIISAIAAYYHYRREESFSQREILRTFIIYPIFPSVTAIFQSVYWRIPLLCYGLTLAMLIVHLTSTRAMISLDPLTQLNNRNQLGRYLPSRLNSYEEGAGTHLYLLMIDINYFKQINDRFGHLIGDQALVHMADAMRLACQDRHYHSFLSRYGGDEFVIVLEAENREVVQGIIASLRAHIAEIAAERNAPYDLTISAAAARYVPGETRSAAELIAAADRLMYEEKKRTHRAV